MSVEAFDVISPVDETIVQTVRFADRVSFFFRPDALDAWERHGEQGDLRVIVTASPEETVRPFAEALKADDLIGTRRVASDHERDAEHD